MGLSECWGDLGHHTTGHIANQYLKKDTLDVISSILGTYKGPNNKTFKDISEIATYPDEIRDLVPWATTYHYVDMKKNETKYNEASQCSQPHYCIVKALQNYTNILKDPKIHDVSRLGEALSFTVHFMGGNFLTNN